MKKTIFLYFILIFSTANFFAQEYDTLHINYSNSGYETIDTILYQSNNFNMSVLAGTTVLQTRSTIKAAFEGLFLQKVQLTKCKESGDYEKLTKTGVSDISFYKQDSLFFVELQIVENCCFDFLCELELIGELIDLKYIPYGSYCDCNCCVGLTYQIWNAENVNFDKIRINGDNKTIRKIK